MYLTLAQNKIKKREYVFFLNLFLNSLISEGPLSATLSQLENKSINEEYYQVYFYHFSGLVKTQ